MSGTKPERHTWSSPGYVSDWIEQDVLHDLLSLPRRISVGLVRDSGIEVRRVIDIGAGPGAYLRSFLDAFPDAEGVWIDASEPMEDEARERLADLGDRITYLQADASDPVTLALPHAEVITTSRMVHHFSPDSTRRLYRRAHDALTPGGWFFNLDHYGSPADWEAAYRRVRSTITGRKKDPKDRHPHDHAFQLLSTHLEWVEQAGFATPDVAWKTFFTALLVARRSSRT